MKEIKAEYTGIYPAFVIYNQLHADGINYYF